MRRQQAVGLAWLAAAAALAFAVAAGVPFFATRVPWPVEKALGRALSPGLAECGGGAPGARELLARVVSRLYPFLPGDASFPVSVEVTPGKTVNAFAALGGRIYVYDGLLRQARSPEELAAVLAHEIEHVRRRHIMEAAATRLVTLGALKLAFAHGAPLARVFLSLSFSRRQESAADEGGLRRLRDAKVDVAGFAEFFSRPENVSAFPAMLSDHPANGDRAALARRYAGGPVVPLLSHDEWTILKGICR